MCLMLGADIRLAGASARFRSAGITNGLTGTELGVSWLLPRLVGAAHAWDVILTGREVDAAEAERIGMVSRVCPDDELLDGGARARRADLRLEPARRRDDEEGAVVEPRDRQPRGRDRSREPQPAAGAPDDAEPPGGDQWRRKQKRPPRFED